MVKREEYLKKLLSWKDEQVIKVVSGIRRCGKSTLLKQFIELLQSQGIDSEQIIYLNLEEIENDELYDYKSLYNYITERLCKGRNTYIFLDEIQKVDEFEKAVDSLYVKENTDIYITGSNAYLLSGELATLLSGRYVEISILPLSFKEFCSLKGGDNTDMLLAEYMRDGGFPYVSVMEKTTEKVSTYLEGIFNTIVIKDIEERSKRRETDADKRKINDIALLKSIAKYLASSVGNLISTKSIADYISSSYKKVSQNTVSDYISALEEAFIFYSADRFNVPGKAIMKTYRKLYIADLGLRRYLLARKNYDLGFSLENIVYLELLRRGYNVSVGKVQDLEVDFVARKDDRTEYYQVTANMTDESTFEREIKPLRLITDNYPKTILTLDRFTLGDYEGIEVRSVVDWLL